MNDEHAPGIGIEPARESRAASADVPPGHTVEEERPGRLLLPLVLFLATCATTYMRGGFAYAASLLTILLCHEFGHYIQARRYHVPASLPYFIPVPPGLSLFGTMGAVIGMSPNIPHRRALFDIGVSGPLAGLVPAVIFSVLGVLWATVTDPTAVRGPTLGEPLLFQAFAKLIWGDLPPGTDLTLHGIGYAGWVGFLITSLNLLPIGQLDGGHILYSILRHRANMVSMLLLLATIAAVVWMRAWGWSVMLGFLLLMGPQHPPTADDEVPLGTPRVVLGWLTLAFLIVGFTPTPFVGM